jgi:pentatricopeptide repeat protein
VPVPVHQAAISAVLPLARRLLLPRGPPRRFLHSTPPADPGVLACRLTSHAVVRFRGPEAERFLNPRLTSDGLAHAASTEPPRYAPLPSCPRGRRRPSTPRCSRPGQVPAPDASVLNPRRHAAPCPEQADEKETGTNRPPENASGQRTAADSQLRDAFLHLPAARELFDRRPQKNLFLWSAIVFAYSRHGQPLDAFALYRRMQQAGSTNDSGGGT